MAEDRDEHGKTELKLGSDADYGIFGVRAKRDDHPVRPPTIDRQRIYTGPGTAGMGTTPRLKNTGGTAINVTRAGSFKGRRRTLSKG